MSISCSLCLYHAHVYFNSLEGHTRKVPKYKPLETGGAGFYLMLTYRPVWTTFQVDRKIIKADCANQVRGFSPVT